MPEPGHCRNTEMAKPLSIDCKPSKCLESAPIQAIDYRQSEHTMDHDLPAGKGRPEMESSPGTKAIPRGDVMEQSDGDKDALLESAKIMSPGALGPVPFRRGLLGVIARTRQNTREKVSEASSKGIEVAAIAGYNAQCSVLKAYAEADRKQFDNNVRLTSRAGVIYRWKNEFEKIVEIIIKEIDSVQEARRRIVRAVSVLELVKNICKDMMRVRYFRIDADLVLDDQVSEQVIKELSLCDGIKDVYVRLLDQMKMQIEELKTAKQRLEFEWSNKSEAYEIDATTRGLNSDSNTILWKTGSVKLPPDQSSPSSYEYSISEIIIEGTTAKYRSCTLRAYMELIIEKAVHDLRDQADRTDLALTEQIQLQEQELRRLEAKLIKDLQQLADTESLVDVMRDSSKKLDGTMKCAQTRLAERLLRPGVENCRDVLQFGLIEEVKSLSENVAATVGQMKRTGDSTITSMETRRNIERELIMTRKSLHIDRERCQLLRTFYPSAKTLAAN